MKLCPDCREEKDLSDFYLQKSERRAGQPSTYCKPCTQERSKRRYADDPERSRRRHKDWVERNPEVVKLHRIKSAYGMSAEDYQALPQVCVICGTDNKLCVDHNHDSGRVRGLLCSKCNSGLAFFGDSPSLLFRAAEYVLGIASPDIFRETYDPVDVSEEQ